MKRRSFIGMLGAAVTAPAMPMAAPSAQLQALISAHVRKYPVITALGISNRIGVPIEEAKDILTQLSRNGLVGPVRKGSHVHMRATSQVFKPSPAMVHAADCRRMQRQLERAHFNRRRMVVRHTDWLAHLRGICEANNITLQPRALEYAA